MFRLSKEGTEFVKKELTRYEDKKSAIIPSLYRGQAENKGWVSSEVVDELSRVMEIPTSQINEVLTFYTMFNKEPVGKYHIQVCCTLSCAMAEARELTDYICEKLKVKDGEITADGRFSVTRVECLGSCGTAPMAAINDDYHENLTREKVDRLLEELR